MIYRYTHTRKRQAACKPGAARGLHGAAAVAWDGGDSKDSKDYCFMFRFIAFIIKLVCSLFNLMNVYVGDSKDTA